MTDLKSMTMPELLGYVDNVIDINRGRRQCSATWADHDNRNEIKCLKPATTFCDACQADVCLDHVRVLGVAPLCEICYGIKAAELEQLLREAK